MAWLLENQFSEGGTTRTHLSIETYRFDADGSCVIRTYYRVPAPGDGELGTLFESYLPRR